MTEPTDNSFPGGQGAEGYLRFWALGASGVSLSGLQQPRVLALLAVLVLHPHRQHSRNQVAELLWPGRPANNARASLRQLLHRVRSATQPRFGQSPIETDRHALWLNPDFPLESDLASFQRALEVGEAGADEILWQGWWAYGGPFLADFPLDEMEESFGTWVTEKRSGLRDRARSLAHLLIERSLAAGDPDQALRVASRYRRLEPEDYQGRELWDRVLSRTQLAEEDPDGAAGAAERRMITVVYCEPFQPAEGAPESRLAAMAQRRHRLRQVLAEHGARVEGTPDGSLVGYFGLPPEAEEAGSRARRAAQALREADKAGTVGGGGLRVGLHSGRTLMAPEGHPDLLGEIVRQALAAARSTELGEIRATGEASPARAGAGSGEGAGEGPALAGPPALVGRRSELARLLCEARRLRTGRGAVARVLGEPGVGKTRLLQGLRQDLRGRLPMLTVKASAAKADSPYAPIMAALLHLAGCDEMATLEEQRQGLAEYLRRRTALTVHQREALLGLVSAGDEAAGAVTPRPALETLFREWAGRPLVLVFEDWHWADSASRALLDGLAELAGRAPLLLVVTARRGADCPEWPRQVALDLDPLPPADTESLLARLGAPEKDRSELAALSGGVPLYAEELVRLGGGEAAASRSRTLQELIAARLDAVGPAKRTAQIGSIVGRGFTPRLVAWVDDREQAAVAREIDALEAADLVIRHRTSQGLYYQFKHTLIEEAVYASLPAEERRFLHGRLAAVVEREFPTQAATHPEGLADQYRRAGQPDRAAPLYLRAADRSAHLGAHAEALAHLDRAADQAGAMPHGEERTALERQVERSRVAQALFPDGWRDSLSQPVADEADFDGLLTRTFQELPQGRWTELMARSRRLLAMAHHSGDADQIRTARHLLGFCAFYAGEYAEAEQHFRDVLPEAAEDAPSWLVHLYHGPPKAVELVYRGLTALWRGHYQGTERFVARALELARGFGSPSLSGYVLVLAAAYYRHTFQPDQVLTLTAEALDLGRAERVRTARLGGLAYRQWARAALGQPTHLDRTVRILRAQGGSGAGVVAVVAVLPAYGRLGRWRDQLRLASGILHGTDRLQSSETHKSMLYTEIGRARLALGDWAEGEASLERSIAITRREGNRLRYIRAVLPLARHLRLKGEPDRAARLLREAIETLPADSGSPDLAAAQRLLDLTAAPAPAPSLNSLSAQP